MLRGDGPHGRGQTCEIRSRDGNPTEEGTNRGKSSVPRARRIVPLALKAFEESENDVRPEIGDVERHGLDVQFGDGKLEQETKCVAVAADRLGANVSIRGQMLDKELLKQRSDEGSSMSYSSPPEVANMAKRSEAPASNPGVATTSSCRLG